MADFVAKFTEPKAFSIKFGTNSAFSVKFGNLGAGFDLKFGGAQMSETFKGAYNVIPRVEDQILLTEKKYMKKDVKIMAVPVFYVTNSAGGSTVNIASLTSYAILGQAIIGEVVL